MARLKTDSFEDCINDCLKSIELETGNMKGYFLLAQAQLALDHPNEALSSALTAYEKCIFTLSSSTQAVSNLVLKAKKEKWAAKERERVRRANDLLRELEDGIIKKKADDIQALSTSGLEPTEEFEQREEIETAARQKLEDLRSIFAIADPQNMTRRVGRVACSHVTSQ